MRQKITGVQNAELTKMHTQQTSTKRIEQFAEADELDLLGAKQLHDWSHGAFIETPGMRNFESRKTSNNI